MLENIKYNIKLFIASLLTIFLLLLSWYNFYNLGCVSLLFPFIVLVVISFSFIDIKINERICFRNCYFKKKSLFSKILSSRVFVIIFYLIVSVALTFSLMFGIIGFSNFIWPYLVIHIAIVTFIYQQISKLLRNIIQDRYLDIFSREWTINISSILLLFIYIYIFINGYEPEYLSSDFVQTIMNATNSVSSSCKYIAYLLRFYMEMDSALWWVVMNLSEVSDKGFVKSTIWISFIFVNSLAVFGINRFIVQIVYLLDHLLKGRSNEK